MPLLRKKEGASRASEPSTHSGPVSPNPVPVSPDQTGSGGDVDALTGPRRPDTTIPESSEDRQPSEPKPNYGESNTTFTKDEYEKAKEELRKMLNDMQAGVNPRLLMLGIQMGGYHVEAGVRSFSAWSAQMVEDVGEGLPTD